MALQVQSDLAVRGALLRILDVSLAQIGDRETAGCVIQLLAQIHRRGRLMLGLTHHGLSLGASSLRALHFAGGLSLRLRIEGLPVPGVGLEGGRAMLLVVEHGRLRLLSRHAHDLVVVVEPALLRRRPRLVPLAVSNCAALPVDLRHLGAGPSLLVVEEVALRGTLALSREEVVIDLGKIYGLLDLLLGEVPAQLIVLVRVHVLRRRLRPARPALRMVVATGALSVLARRDRGSLRESQTVLGQQKYFVKIF